MNFTNIYLKFPTSKGFTLIELLVVISIIGLMSSVILTSVNTARAKAKGSSLKAQLIQMRSVMALEYNEKGSYAALASGPWVSVSSNIGGNGNVTCDQAYQVGVNPSNYTAQMNAICKKLLTFNAGASTNPWVLYIAGDSNTFSIEIWADFNSPPTLIYCVGSSGRSTFGKAWGDGPNTPSQPDPGLYVYNNAGCQNNP